MIKKNAQSLGEILDEFIKSQHLDEKLYETRLLNSYPQVVGSGIAAHTKRLYIKDGILYVSLDSSVIRNEMQLMRQNLISRLNGNIGHDIIRDIIFR
jgi:predicted nucleic acid-binding Zn ribbon protein